MIRRNDKPLERRYHGENPVVKIYYGLLLVWELVSSCLSGIWDNALPYSGEEPFRNNPK